jgi:hypothetical protein
VTVEKTITTSNAEIKKKIELTKGILPKPAGIINQKSQAISVVSARQEFESKVEQPPAVIVSSETSKDGRILVKEPGSTTAIDEVKKALN